MQNDNINETHKIYRFQNGYGASVICNPLSYGGVEGLKELAVIKFNANGEYTVAYDTPITGDVIGWLNDSQVSKLLTAIEAL